MPKITDRSIFRDTALATASWLVFALLNTLAFTTTGNEGAFWAAFWHELVMCIPYWSTWGPSTILVLYLSRRLPITKSDLTQQLFSHAAIGLLLSLAQITFYIFVSPFFQMPFCQCEYMDVLTRYDIPRLYFGWRLLYGQLIYWGLVGAEHAIRHYQQVQEQKLATAKLEAILAQTKLDSVKARLQPHFLFNSFHTIVSMIETGLFEEARNMSVRLSDLFRHVLSLDDHQLTKLSEEFEFAESYLAIEQIRFSDRMSFDISADPDLQGISIPRLLLQPLIENAVRHGVASSVDHVQITITARRERETLILSVQNDHSTYTELASHDKGLGLGHKLTRERLEHLYGSEGKFEFRRGQDGKSEATIEIPLKMLSEGR